MICIKSKIGIRSIQRAFANNSVMTSSFFHTVPASSSKSSSTIDDNQKELKTQARKFHSLNTDTKYQLCFLRHGQSTWNRDNRFIGWTDTPLTDDGVLEARVAGQMLSRSGMKFDEVHTSLLRRK